MIGLINSIAFDQVELPGNNELRTSQDLTVSTLYTPQYTSCQIYGSVLQQAIEGSSSSVDLLRNSEIHRNRNTIGTDR